VARARVGASLLLFLLLLGAYLATGRVHLSGDSLPARYLPWSLLRHGSFALDRFPEVYEEPRAWAPLLDGLPYFVRRHGGHYLSSYSPGPALVALPIVAMPVLAGAPTAWAPALEKLAASVIAALSAAFVFLSLERLVSRRWAVALTLIYGLGTSTLSVSSQALWQHGPTQLAVAVMVWAITGPIAGREAWLAGLAMASAAAIRGSNALLVLPVGLWLVWRHPRLSPWLALGAAPAVAAVAAYNLAYFGAPTPGGARLTTAPVWTLFAQTPFLEGLAGVLASPARGLFVYSPVLLFSLAGAALAWRHGPPVLVPLGAGAALLVVLVSNWAVWWGGHCWGPRLLADALPIFAVLLAPAARWIGPRRGLRAAFALLAALSVGVHALGAYLYDARWDAESGANPPLSRFWSWRDGPIAFYARPLLREARGWIATSAEEPRTSASAPELLRAAYEVSGTRPSASPRERLALAVDARNTGRATWLAAAPGDIGAVKLGWRWWRDGALAGEGRASLSRDVPPGATARFLPSIEAPSAPGRYALALDLVSEGVAWFAQRGPAPPPIAVTVEPLDLARVLSGAPGPSATGPTGATLALDRERAAAGESLRLHVTVTNRRLRAVDAYLLLEGEGAVRSFDGQRVAEGGPAGWDPWLRSMPLPSRAQGRFTVALPRGIAGRYTWHAVVTEPGTYQVLAAASAGLEIQPGR
jgi:hypothetical protein